MHLSKFIKVGYISFLLISSSLYARSIQDKNATYIELPKVPKVNIELAKPQKAIKVAPLVTIVPKIKDKKITITNEEYLEYQRLKAKNK